MEVGGKLAGRLPFIAKRRAIGVKSLEMPMFTYVLGPAILPEFATCGAVRSLKEYNIITKLVKALPAAAHVSFRLHAATNNALAFAANGFQVTVDPTVEILPAEPNVLWQKMRDKARNMVRRAGEQLTVRTCTDPGFFGSFYADCLTKSGKRNTYDENLLRPLVAGASLRQTGKVLVADLPDGTPVAAIFTVWDGEREYYFMSARRQNAHAGAINLLIWSALCNAAKSGRIFDMAGFHVHAPDIPNMLLLTGFGGTIVPRFRVFRTTPALRAVSTISSLFGRKAGM